MAFITATNELPPIDEMDLIEDLPQGARLVTWEHEVFVAYPDGTLKRLVGKALQAVSID